MPQVAARKISVFLAGPMLLVALLFLAPQLAHAKSFTYQSYDVDITVNQDTTMTVVEKLNYVFDGSFSEVIRGIQIDNPDVRRACENSGNLTCGGFEYIALEEVRDNKGRILPRDEYTVGKQEYDDGSSYYVIDWKFPTQTFNGQEVFSVQIKYKVFGGVRFVGDSPYVYWNVLPRDKGGEVGKSQLTLRLPEELPDVTKLDVYGNFRYASKVQGHNIIVNAEELPETGDFTIAYKLAKGALAKPAHVRISGNPIGQNLSIDGILVGTTDFELNYFPPGKHVLRGEFAGYVPNEITVEVKEGDDKTIDLNLLPLPATQLLIYLNLLCILLGCVLIPAGGVGTYLLWKRKGRDQDKIETVIPLFNPPTGMRPYMVGSLIDEVVDKRDVSGTIIDLAYRGFIKIVELQQGKNYQLTNTGKDQTELSEVEQDLMSALFAASDEVETKELQTFALRYPRIVTKIYRQMVNEGYFTTSPQITRNTYAGCGVGLIIFGIAVSVALIGLAIGLIGQIGPFTLGIAVFVFGVGMLIISKHMSAKTSHGSKVYNEILGFKMYLETAEKYRLQNLTPEEFEKFLSYAIVFGVEEQWAAKFKDIYKEPPEWYQSSHPDMFTTYWLTRSLNSFSHNMQNSVFTPTSGGARGSGWSGGGGSFGGFSGGGGGGGFSGAR